MRNRPHPPVVALQLVRRVVVMPPSCAGGYNPQVTLRRAVPPALRALLLVLASALLAAPAQASLPSRNDLARAGEELQAQPSPVAADLPRELPSELPKEWNGPFCVEPPKTRVGGFELRLSCQIGGEAGLTCGSRPAYGFGCGGRAVERSVFTGHVFDTETGLYYAKARYFDPKLGRFLTQDSFLGNIDEPPSLHRYLYANDNPTTFVDPTGFEGEKQQQTPSWVHWAVGAVEGMDEFQKRLDKLPEQAAQQTVNLLTPGHSQNKGVVAQKQRDLLAVARDPKKPVVARVEAASEALKMQPAAIVEETVVRPAMEAPGHAKAAGQHLAQAEAATSPVEKAVHYLEATKEAAQAFTGMATPVALVSGGRTPVAGTSEAEAVPRAVRVGEAATDDFASQATGAARQTMATGKEWYDYLASRYGSSNVEWVSGSGRTIQWPSQLPAPPASEMLRVRPSTRSGSFVPDLTSAAGSRPAGAVAHHVKPLFMGGSDSGTTNAAWTAEAAHQAGHATLNREVVPLPYGTWIVVKP